MNWFISVLKRPIEFSGRARRKEYWYFMGISVLISVILTIIDNALGWYSVSEEIGILSGIFTLFIILPSLSVTARRLHDTGRTGWWMLLYFIPIIGFFVMLYFLVLDSENAENVYGSNPKLSAKL
ncbi:MULTISPECIES: DUF805 domain-containing protein [Vibrio]|uniref:DUF805 domain-containing protein n=1 Tax=Vibrio qingdaonensis TaxID=2829491 RepID=A0A9X3HVA6_9VIBR|nr:DUF805 domain-containing protein [Vibrio qingdaonensis]MCW8345096.1 DUF805 domain-containing protein [Vibrio qingdaonensis]